MLEDKSESNYHGEGASLLRFVHLTFQEAMAGKQIAKMIKKAAAAAINAGEQIGEVIKDTFGGVGEMRSAWWALMTFITFYETL